METFYDNFADPTNEFTKEPRAFCYGLATQFVDRGKTIATDNWPSDTDTIKGLLLLLFTWNFAAKETKRLNFTNLAKILEEVKADLITLQHYSIEDVPDEVWPHVQRVFDRFRGLCGQTGASKALSLLNPHLFVMWDTAIRDYLRKHLIPGIDNGRTGE